MKQLNKVFGIKNEIRAHQLENELLTLDHNNFSSIEDFYLSSRPLDFSWKVLRLRVYDTMSGQGNSRMGRRKLIDIISLDNYCLYT